MIDALSNSVCISCAVSVPVIVAPTNVGDALVATDCKVPPPFSVVKSDSFVVTLVEREPLADSKVVVLVEKLALDGENEPVIPAEVRFLIVVALAPKEPLILVDVPVSNPP